MSEVEPMNQLDIGKLNKTAESEEQHTIVLEDWNQGPSDSVYSIDHHDTRTLVEW